MKSTIKYLVLIIMCWVCGENLQAQPYMFRNVVMSDGLSGLLVNAIYKDSEGFIWLGTDNGLDRFDGVKVKHFEFRGVDSGTVLQKPITSNYGSEMESDSGG